MIIYVMILLYNCSILAYNNFLLFTMDGHSNNKSFIFFLEKDLMSESFNYKNRLELMERGRHKACNLIEDECQGHSIMGWILILHTWLINVSYHVFLYTWTNHVFNVQNSTHYETSLASRLIESPLFYGTMIDARKIANYVIRHKNPISYMPISNMRTQMHK